jgi:hypothetical protein
MIGIGRWREMAFLRAIPTRGKAVAEQIVSQYFVVD